MRGHTMKYLIGLSLFLTCFTLVQNNLRTQQEGVASLSSVVYMGSEVGRDNIGSDWREDTGIDEFSIDSIDSEDNSIPMLKDMGIVDLLDTHPSQTPLAHLSPKSLSNLLIKFQHQLKELNKSDLVQHCHISKRKYIRLKKKLNYLLARTKALAQGQSTHVCTNEAQNRLEKVPLKTNCEKFSYKNRFYSYFETPKEIQSALVELGTAFAPFVEGFDNLDFTSLVRQSEVSSIIFDTDSNVSFGSLSSKDRLVCLGQKSKEIRDDAGYSQLLFAALKEDLSKKDEVSKTDLKNILKKYGIHSGNNSLRTQTALNLAGVVIYEKQKNNSAIKLKDNLEKLSYTDQQITNRMNALNHQLAQMKSQPGENSQLISQISYEIQNLNQRKMQIQSAKTQWVSQSTASVELNARYKLQSLGYSAQMIQKVYSNVQNRDSIYSPVIDGGLYNPSPYGLTVYSPPSVLDNPILGSATLNCSTPASVYNRSGCVNLKTAPTSLMTTTSEGKDAFWGAIFTGDLNILKNIQGATTPMSSTPIQSGNKGWGLNPLPNSPVQPLNSYSNQTP